MASSFLLKDSAWAVLLTVTIWGTAKLHGRKWTKATSPEEPIQSLRIQESNLKSNCENHISTSRYNNLKTEGWKWCSLRISSNLLSLSVQIHPKSINVFDLLCTNLITFDLPNTKVGSCLWLSFTDVRPEDRESRVPFFSLFARVTMLVQPWFLLNVDRIMLIVAEEYRTLLMILLFDGQFSVPRFRFYSMLDWWRCQRPSIEILGRKLLQSLDIC